MDSANSAVYSHHHGLSCIVYGISKKPVSGVDDFSHQTHRFLFHCIVSGEYGTEPLNSRQYSNQATLWIITFSYNLGCPSG
jgi:hypothetical protein